MHEAMTDLILLMGKRGFRPYLLTGRSWRGLFPGCHRRLVLVTIIFGPLSSLSLLLPPSAPCSFKRWTCCLSASVPLDLFLRHNPALPLTPNLASRWRRQALCELSARLM